MSESAIKLTIYFSERERSGERFLADALFDLYERHRMHTSVLLRGFEGFGGGHRLHTDRVLTLSESLPAVSIAVDRAERIESALPEVLALAGEGLVTLERARLVSVQDPQLPAGDKALLKLSVYGGRSPRSAREAGYVRAVELLRNAGAAGASVLLAVDGTLHGERRRARFFARNAHVPLMVLAIAPGSVIANVLPALAQLLDDPVATIERVQLCKLAGRLIAEPEVIPESDPSGLPIWQKLMVHTEEQAKHRGRPLHVELVRRLREEGVAGASLLRGVRGFYGDGEPFTDRITSLRRNVPIHVVLVDAPAAVRRWWPIVNELTDESGVVTSELVPASRFAGGRGAVKLAASSR